MAEFQEMVREFNRLCETQRRLHKNTCDKCPIKIATMGTMLQCYRYVLEKPKETENIVMSWASEHPVVYPTWYEWLTSIGAVTRKVKPDVALNLIETGLLDPIHADLAEKLGVKPKEGV